MHRESADENRGELHIKQTLFRQIVYAITGRRKGERNPIKDRGENTDNDTRLLSISGRFMIFTIL